MSSALSSSMVVEETLRLVAGLPVRTSFLIAGRLAVVTFAVPDIWLFVRSSVVTLERTAELTDETRLFLSET